MASLFAGIARQRPEDKTWCPRCQQWVDGEPCPTCAWPGDLPEDLAEERDRREETAAARNGF